MTSWLRRALRWLAIVAAAVVVVAVGTTFYILLAWDRPVASPVREMQAPRDAQTVARGEYLYQRGTLCWTCHGSEGSTDRGEPQAGGRLFDLSDVGPGFGRVWASNLTADPETGMGAVSDGALVRAIREGVDHQGRVIFPVMAYQFYHGLSDADALAIVAYLRTLSPVRRSVPPRELSFAAKALMTFGMIGPEEPVTTPAAAPPAGSTVEYGRYVTWHASGCAECHTPRFPSNGQLDRTRLMGGGLFSYVEPSFTAHAPNLTADATTGLGGWTEAQFVAAMRTGVRPNGTVMLPFMPWPAYASWSDDELHAVWLYLRSEPAVSHRPPASVLTGKAAGPPGVSRGDGLFEAYCAACHGHQGRGGALTTAALTEEAPDLDAETLAGIIRDGGPSGSGMPGFGKTLEPDQIADLVTYLRGR